MPSHRMERLNKDFKREISGILTEMKDERVNRYLAVTRVEVTSDLSYAKVLISSVLGVEQAKEACEVLKKAEGHVKTELSHRLRIRKIPELTFIPDDSVDYYNKINTIIEGFQHE